MKYTNYIFDFDGTISDSYPAFARSFVKLLSNHGITDSYDHVYEVLHKYSVAFAIKSYDFGCDNKTIGKEYKILREEECLNNSFPVDGIKDLLEYIRLNGGRCYLYTHNDEFAFSCLKKWGLNDYFSGAILGSDKFPRKPAPDALLSLVHQKKIKINDCLMIGDRDIDIGAARNAGIDGCLFDEEHLFDSCEAKIKVTKLKDIIMFIN